MEDDVMGGKPGKECRSPASGFQLTNIDVYPAHTCLGAPVLFIDLPL